MKDKSTIKLPRILISLLVIFLLFWFTLPPINLRSIDFWIFIATSIIIVYVINFFSTLKDWVISFKKAGHGSFSTNANGTIIFNKSSNPVKLAPLGRSLKTVLIILAAMFVLGVIGTLAGAEIFNAGSYKDLLIMVDGDFTEDVAEISMSQIPVVDRDTASRLGNRKLGEMSDLVSQFEIQENYTQINYLGTPTRVTPLRYGDPIKWLYNQSSGIPAYIQVNMVTQETTLIRLTEGIRYSESEYFLRDINRHLRFHYPTKIFDQISFEIDEDGTPYWVAPTITYRIGLWNGRDIDGAVLVNAITGESQYYALGDIPVWVDQVFISDLIIQHLDFNGKYQSGFFNSVFGQRGVLQTTTGYNYLAMGDDVYLYTGITSVAGDQSNIGFVLVNMRTKETRFYTIPGAEEVSAMDSAEGQVQHLGYYATFPLLLNISNRPTYFLSLKDDAGLVKMYAFVDVEQYQVVGTGSTIDAAQADYASKLKSEDLEITIESDTQEISGSIDSIASAVVDGNTCYYFTLKGEASVYTAYIQVSETLPFLAAGDDVTLTYTESDNIRDVVSIIKK